MKIYKRKNTKKWLHLILGKYVIIHIFELKMQNYNGYEVLVFFIFERQEEKYPNIYIQNI